MKLIAKKPVLFGKDVLSVGQPFDTHEQHARQLIQKGYAIAQSAHEGPVAPVVAAVADGEQPPGPLETSVAEKAAELVNQNQPEVVASVADVKDLALLRALLEAEQAGKGRQGVSKAIADAIEKLEKSAS